LWLTINPNYTYCAANAASSRLPWTTFSSQTRCEPHHIFLSLRRRQWRSTCGRAEVCPATGVPVNHDRLFEIMIAFRKLPQPTSPTLSRWGNGELFCLDNEFQETPADLSVRIDTRRGD